MPVQVVLQKSYTRLLIKLVCYIFVYFMAGDFESINVPAVEPVVSKVDGGIEAGRFA